MRNRENLPAKLTEKNWAIAVEGRGKAWYLHARDGEIKLFTTRKAARLSLNKILLRGRFDRAMKVVKVSVMELEWRCKSGVRKMV